MNKSDNTTGELPMTVLVDGEPQLEYHRGKPLAEAQRGYLDRMDAAMESGIQLGGVEVMRPDTLQRAQFVAIQVIEALRSGNDALSAAGCAYLATRLPDLTQVRARLVGGGFSAELVFNQPYVKETTVSFSPRRLS
jgi:hypothetical protein